MAKFRETASSSLKICQILPFSWQFYNQIRVICHVTKKIKTKHLFRCFWRENYLDYIRLAEHSRSSCSESILKQNFHYLNLVQLYMYVTSKRIQPIVWSVSHIEVQTLSNMWKKSWSEFNQILCSHSNATNACHQVWCQYRGVNQCVFPLKSFFFGILSSLKIVWTSFDLDLIWRCT